MKEALKRTPDEGTKSAQETPQDSEESGDEGVKREDKKALKLVPFEGFQFQESPRGTPPLTSPKGPARPQFFGSSGVETPPPAYSANTSPSPSRAHGVGADMVSRGFDPLPGGLVFDPTHMVTRGSGSLPGGMVFDPTQMVSSPFSQSQ